MNALRQTHASLVRGGRLLDVHPIPPSSRIEAAGKPIGRLDERVFFAAVRAAERELARVVDAGLFRRLRRVDRDVVTRYGSAADLVEWAGECEDIDIPRAVRERVDRTTGPVDVVERLTFRLFEALPS